MSFRDFVQRTATGARVVHAQAAVRAIHGRGAARWLAGEAGISPRTARRWLSGSYPRGRAGEILAAAIAAAGATGTAAARIRVAEVIEVDLVEVFYDGISQGTRSIGALDVDDVMARYLDRCASDLERGDLEGAAEAFSAAIINGYQDGLEDTLYLEDFDSVEVHP